MKKIILYTLLFIVANVLLFLLLVFIGKNLIKSSGDYDLSAFFFILISFVTTLILELIAGGVLAANTMTKEIGKGLLLSEGLSYCLDYLFAAVCREIIPHTSSSAILNQDRGNCL